MWTLEWKRGVFIFLVLGVVAEAGWFNLVFYFKESIRERATEKITEVWKYSEVSLELLYATAILLVPYLPRNVASYLALRSTAIVPGPPSVELRSSRVAAGQALVNREDFPHVS